MTPAVWRCALAPLALVACTGCITQQNDLAQFTDSAGVDGNADAAASDGGDGGGDAARSETASTDSARDDAVTTIDGASDAPSDGPASCPYVLCEDFEKGAAPAGWTLDEDHGTATVESTRVAHGKFAAHFHLEAGGHHARFVDAAPRAALEGHLFGRVYLAFDALPDPHSYFFTAGPPNDSHYEVGSYSGGYQLTWWKPGAEKPVGGAKLPMGKWWCLEFEITDAPSAITAWTDGTLGAELKDIGTGLVGAMKERTLGFTTFATTTTAIDVWADDLALDTKRIGCL
ncbi:MAG: hypothetical protein NVS3B10_27160 [Polyangiales bacterium]